MGTLYYTLSLSDSIAAVEQRNQSLSFDERKVLSRTVKNADGAVSFTLTDIGTVTAVLIRTDKAVTVSIDSNTLTVDGVLFLTSGADITTLSVACSEVTPGASVDVVVWAEAA